MPRRLDEARRAELLDGLMSLISARGFAELSTSQIAAELGCSVATLYRLAPTKEEIVLRAIERWREMAFEDMEQRTLRCSGHSERARTYFRIGAEKLHPMSLAFYTDVQRSELVRKAWRTSVVDRYIDRFVEFVGDAQEAGEARSLNTVFLGEVLKAIGFLTRDERVLREAGLTSEEAVLEVDRLLWDGISER